jgi:hypothetical protein
LIYKTYYKYTGCVIGRKGAMSGMRLRMIIGWLD